MKNKMPKVEKYVKIDGKNWIVLPSLAFFREKDNLITRIDPKNDNIAFIEFEDEFKDYINKELGPEDKEFSFHNFFVDKPRKTRKIMKKVYQESQVGKNNRMTLDKKLINDFELDEEAYIALSPDNKIILCKTKEIYDEYIGRKKGR